MRELTAQTAGGISFIGGLTLLFIGLKLTGVINWSWWWVLAPAWIAAAISLFMVAVLGALFGAIYLLDRKHKPGQR